MNCRKITTRFWCMISSTQWVFMWTYLCLLLRIRTLSSWWYNFSVANSFCAKNKASKSSHNFTAFVLRQNQFYSIGPQWGERSITWANALFRIFRVAARSLTDWVSEWVQLKLKKHHLPFGPFRSTFHPLPPYHQHQHPSSEIESTRAKAFHKINSKRSATTAATKNANMFSLFDTGSTMTRLFSICRDKSPLAMSPIQPTFLPI